MVRITNMQIHNLEPISKTFTYFVGLIEQMNRFEMHITTTEYQLIKDVTCNFYMFLHFRYHLGINIYQHISLSYN